MSIAISISTSHRHPSLAPRLPQTPPNTFFLLCTWAHLRSNLSSRYCNIEILVLTSSRRWCLKVADYFRRLPLSYSSADHHSHRIYPSRAIYLPSPTFSTCQSQMPKHQNPRTKFLNFPRYRHHYRRKQLLSGSEKGCVASYRSQVPITRRSLCATFITHFIHRIWVPFSIFAGTVIPPYHITSYTNVRRWPIFILRI